MRRVLSALAILWVLALFGSEVCAQPPREPPPRAVRTEVIRPPEGSLRRGAFAVPAWLVCVGGGLVTVAAGGALAWRIKKRAP